MIKATNQFPHDTIRFYKGFTLAETLITLVIIGVVAALTVPNLIIKHQKEETVTRLKKAYSSLAQTTLRATSEHGPISTWEVPEVANNEGAKQFLNTYLVPYLNVIKLPSTSGEGKWNNKYTFLNGNPATFHGVRFYLSDGTSFTADFRENSTTTKRLLVYIDVNGDKKPNKMGRDIFEVNYWILSSNKNNFGKVRFWGEGNKRETLLASSSYNCNKNDSGSGCGALILADSWQIKDDYPW